LLLLLLVLLLLLPPLVEREKLPSFMLATMPLLKRLFSAF
jgi:hypothetical protein